MSIKQRVHSETWQQAAHAGSSVILRGRILEGNSAIQEVKIAQLMRIRFLLANSILFGLFASVALAQAAPAQTPTAARTRNLTVDDYFRIKDVEDAQISPDGKWVAYVVTTHDVKEDKDKK